VPSETDTPSKNDDLEDENEQEEVKVKIILEY
jgi:hypothetical protein